MIVLVTVPPFRGQVWCAGLRAGPKKNARMPSATWSLPKLIWAWTTDELTGMRFVYNVNSDSAVTIVPNFPPAIT